MRVVTTLAVVLAGLAAHATSSCGLESAWTHCESSNSGSQIDIVGEQTSPGVTAPRGGGSQAPAPSEPGRPQTPLPADDGCTQFNLESQGIVDGCLEAQESEPAEDAEPGIPAVTAQDVASFAPAAPPLQGEPAGVGVVGMPANFVAGVETQTIGGALFGRAVSVRFTPVAYVFDYGDGTLSRTTSGGATWASLGQAQFSATPTSHAYGARGAYVASVTVEYAAAVDFGVGRWFPVTGVVSVASGGYPVQIYEVRTALVDKTCAENPSGPGC
jgi:hypothetical protein